jgi:hypothetical protein
MKNAAFGRYMRRFILLMLAYVAAIIGVILWFSQGGPQGWLRYVVAVLPALPIIGMIAAIGAFLVEQEDEYLKMLMVRQQLAATGFTLVVTTIWGFLETFTLVPHVPAYAVFVLYCAGQVPSAIAFNLRRA